MKSRPYGSQVKTADGKIRGRVMGEMVSPKGHFTLVRPTRGRVQTVATEDLVDATVARPPKVVDHEP